MFSPFKKKSAPIIQINFEDIGVDFHAHWLPGVDDGCQSIEDSIHILSVFKELGYKKVYASPHIMGDKYTNTKSDLQNRFNEFKKLESVQSKDLELGLLAEYLLDEKFEDQLKANDFLTIGNNYILVETSMNYEFPFVRDYIFELLKLGYKPIIAHPERYRYIYNEKNYIDIYEEMQSWGLEFQLNLFSLVGLFGEAAQKTAESLIDNELYSYVCSDIHIPMQIKFFEEAKKSIYLDKLIQSNKLKNKEFL
jgi:tyrosine-protein phosphatase YwqE